MKCSGPTQKNQNSVLMPNEFNFNSDNWISDFVEASYDPVYIKDTDKYILANTGLAQWCGIESVDMLIGTSARAFWIEDVCHRRNKLCLNSAVIHCDAYSVKMAEAHEDQVRSSKRPSAVNHVVLDFNGFICCTNTTKVPILDRDHKKVIAFITLCRYLTSQCDLSELFQLYQKYYPAQIAIELLLKYLKINSYFCKLPTLMEMHILLAMHQHSSRKCIGKLLNISHNTVASHIQHMRDFKLIKPDFDEVLIQLRAAPMDKSKFIDILPSLKEGDSYGVQLKAN